MSAFSTRNSITDESIPDWFDLVIWGHEHECEPQLRTCETTGVRILQPGSTVATSLVEAESKPKHCFQLIIEGDNFQLENIHLERQRKIIYRHLDLAKTGLPKDRKSLLEAYIKREFEAMLE